MKDYIKIGIEKGLISFNDDMSRITYVHQKKERNYSRVLDAGKSPLVPFPQDCYNYVLSFDVRM